MATVDTRGAMTATDSGNVNRLQEQSLPIAHTGLMNQTPTGLEFDRPSGDRRESR